MVGTIRASSLPQTGSRRAITSPGTISRLIAVMEMKIVPRALQAGTKFLDVIYTKVKLQIVKHIFTMTGNV
jgi:hypothetical protein